MNWHYPTELPVVEQREQILAAIRAHQVVIVVSDTGSGKTTQLPKMVAEALGREGGRIGCTQPRRLAAVSVSKRVAEELKVPLGDFVGYQVRFDDKTSSATRLKFMTDGILLAETQGDQQLRQYEALIIDEAHERSLNIDFLLGYIKRLLPKRRDLKLVISSATLDAGAFAAFFANQGMPAPVIEAPGRMFPVTEFFLPPADDEEIPQHVARAVDYLADVEPQGDVLIFLPGEREIRECAEVLVGRNWPNTEVLPLFARLSLGDQQRVFNPGNRRRLILATNVAETSLTIPRIACVVDTGIARVSRWNPAKGVQRLQVEPISQASARQRKGRCGRVRDGICVRLYEEVELTERLAFTDPEIRRSSLAGVILRMKFLGLPEIDEFPFLDAPAPKAIAEGYRTLREIGAIDREKKLTDVGRQIARLPVDPRLGRMLIEARKENCLAQVIPIVAALESNDPRERPADKAREADAAHARWKEGESDFIGSLRLWKDLQKFRDSRGRWQRNALRKFCGPAFLNAMRILEWGNVQDELASLLEREWSLKLGELGDDFSSGASYDTLHKVLLAGVPRQFGLWDRDSKSYRSAGGGFFSIFPGSGLFSLPKRFEWVMAMELVETSRLWARRVARIDPAWVEQVAPHLCKSKYGDAHWDEIQGAAYGKETVICGGLPVVSGRRIHYGRVDPQAARNIFLTEGVLGNRLRKRTLFLDHLEAMRTEIELIEAKLRRPGGLWSDDAVFRFYQSRIPDSIHTAAAFHRWLGENESTLMLGAADVLDEDLVDLQLQYFPDTMTHAGQEYALYYRAEQGTRDDGVTIGIHIDQLPSFPQWLASWGVDGHLRERAEILLRALPIDYRRACHPIAQMAASFAELWALAPKDLPILQALSEHVQQRAGVQIPIDSYDSSKIPAEWITKLWVCDDEGEELAFGEDLAVIKLDLSDYLSKRFASVANAGLERTGLHVWDGESLPLRVETPAGPAYPALTDELTSVGVRAFSCPALARESHRAGSARLMCLAQPDQVALLRKKFPLDLMLKVELPRLGQGGTTIEQLIRVCAEGLLGEEDPRSPAEFKILSEKSRGDWFDVALKVSKSLSEALSLLPKIREWIAAHEQDRNYGPIAQDLAQQLSWLFREEFCWRAGFYQLCRYPIILMGIHARLGRIKALPLVKDLEKMERFHQIYLPWAQLYLIQPHHSESWHLGWALEDYRLFLFAPDLSLSKKFSLRNLENMLRALEKSVT